MIFAFVYRGVSWLDLGRKFQVFCPDVVSKVTFTHQLNKCYTLLKNVFSLSDYVPELRGIEKREFKEQRAYGYVSCSNPSVYRNLKSCFGKVLINNLIGEAVTPSEFLEFKSEVVDTVGEKVVNFVENWFEYDKDIKDLVAQSYPEVDISDTDQYIVTKLFYEGNINLQTRGLNYYVRDKQSSRILEARVGKALSYFEWIGHKEIVFVSNVSLLYTILNDESRELFVYLYNLIGLHKMPIMKIIDVGKSLTKFLTAKPNIDFVFMLGFETCVGFLTLKAAEAIKYDMRADVEEFTTGSTELKSYDVEKEIFTKEQFLVDLEAVLKRITPVQDMKPMTFKQFIADKTRLATQGVARGVKLDGSRMKRSQAVNLDSFYDKLESYDDRKKVINGLATKLEKGKLRAIVSFEVMPSISDGYLAYYFDQLMYAVPDIYSSAAGNNEVDLMGILHQYANNEHVILSYDWKGFERHHSLDTWTTMVRVLADRVVALLGKENYEFTADIEDARDACIERYLDMYVQLPTTKELVKYRGGELSGSRFTALFNNLLNWSIHMIRDMNIKRLGIVVPETLFRRHCGDDAVEVFSTRFKNFVVPALEVMNMMGNLSNPAKTTLARGYCSFLKKFYFAGQTSPFPMLSRLVSSVVQRNPLSGEPKNSPQQLASRYLLLKHPNVDLSKVRLVMEKDMLGAGFNPNFVSLPMQCGGALSFQFMESKDKIDVFVGKVKDKTEFDATIEDTIRLDDYEEEIATKFNLGTDLLRSKIEGEIVNALGSNMKHATKREKKKDKEKGNLVTLSLSDFNINENCQSNWDLFGSCKRYIREWNIIKQCSSALIEPLNKVFSVMIEDDGRVGEIKQFISKFGFGISLDYLFGDFSVALERLSIDLQKTIANKCFALLGAFRGKRNNNMLGTALLVVIRSMQYGVFNCIPIIE